MLGYGTGISIEEKLKRVEWFLSQLEKAEDVPLHHQADICQFRCEILDSWHDDEG